MSRSPFDTRALERCASELAANVRELAARGWTPATSSNFSMRMDAAHVAITASGGDKGRLEADGIMVVDLDGQAVGSDRRPSAETGLHTSLYRRFPDVGCVLHTHSHNQTVASRLFAGQGLVRLEGYELLKAFAGNDTHDTHLDLPVLPNSQDMDELSALADAWLERQPMWGYLIDGHGLYAWGRDMAGARRHLEAFEFLLGCELDLRRLQR